MQDELLVQRKIRRPRRLRSRRPRTLYIAQILAWADAWFERTGRWPMARSGHIPETAGETWNSVNLALREGFRGLPGGSSLRRLLARHRGVRNKSMLPRLSIEQILAWADEWFERTGRWPEAESGYIPGTTGEKWMYVEIALRQGSRGLPGGSSLARLLAQQRGKRNRRALPPYSTRQILAWADAWFERTGRWPNSHSGPIPEAPGETWEAVDVALSQGLRGLPGGSSLPRLLARRRGVRNHMMVPPLSIEQILAWADAHFARTGRWPSRLSGPIPGTRGETWSGVDGALRLGQRGLPGGSSLPRLLAEHRRVPNRHAMPFSVEQILAWADAHFKRTGAPGPGRGSHRGASPRCPANRGARSTWPLRKGCGDCQGVARWPRSSGSIAVCETSTACPISRLSRFWPGPTRITSGLASGRPSHRVSFPIRVARPGPQSSPRCATASADCLEAPRYRGSSRSIAACRIAWP